jgi:Fe-S-cluster containining protein
MATPLQALEHFFAQLDAAIERFEEEQPLFRCPAGCAECCQHMPPFLMSSLEYELICRWVRTHWTEKQQEAVLARARMQASGYEFSQVTKAEEDPALRDALPRYPCPFLGEPAEGAFRCSIYPLRPLACRLYGRTLLTQGPEAGRFNGCDILAKQAGLVPGKTVRMHSADSLRQQLLNLCVAVRDRAGVIAFQTLAKFLVELGFEWSEENLGLGDGFSGAVFQPEARIERLFL